MDITIAATKAHIVNNPTIGSRTFGVATVADEGWIAQQEPSDELVYVRWEDGTLSAIYPDDGTEITGRTLAHDALDAFLASGGTILT